MSSETPKTETPEQQLEHGTPVQVTEAQVEQHTAHDHADQPASAAEQELSDMKLVVLESAELANRSANMATNAGAELKTATKDLVHTIQSHKKFHVIMISVTGTLLILGSLIFGTMTFTLKTRINQMDEMLAAMSKRVGDLNEGLEVVGSVNEGFQEMVSKQAEMSSAQAKLEVRLNELIQTAQAAPQEKNKQADAKDQAWAKQVQALESGLKSQSQAIQSMSGQVQGLQRALGDAGNLKKEMEALAKLQRERQAAEAQLLSQANKPKVAAAPAPERPKDRMVRYPRAETETTPAPGSGVLSTQ
jgi:DNA repair exonuclease SbcCD ATPase subunit